MIDEKIISNKEMANCFLNEILTNKCEVIKFKNVDDNFGDGEAKMLTYLCFIEDGITAGKLCEKLNVSSARIAKILNSLEGKQYIIRKTDDNDKRKTIVVVTDLAKEKMFELKEQTINRIKCIIDELGQDDFREFMRITNRINSIWINLSEKEQGDRNVRIKEN